MLKLKKALYSKTFPGITEVVFVGYIPRFFIFMLEVNVAKHLSFCACCEQKYKVIFLWIQYVCIQRTPILAFSFTPFIVLRDDVDEKAFHVTGCESAVITVELILKVE